MGKYLHAIKSLPRAMRWALVGLVAILLYFAAVEPALDRLNKVAYSAEQDEANLRAFTAQGGAQQKAVQTLELGMSHFGQVEFLGDEATRPFQFNSAVDKILKDNEVLNAKSQTKNQALGQGALTAKMGPEFRVMRHVRDIEFDATPEAVAAVVAALERSPVVATVSRVHVRKIEGREGGERTVHATITAEAWISTKKG